MRLELKETRELLERVRDASRTNFPLACSDLFAHLDQRVSDNPVYLAFEDDRNKKWADWGNGRSGRWRMPDSRSDRLSLAYDLFRTVSETKDDGASLLFHLYRKNFSANVDAFREDFLRHLVDAINEIWRAEPQEIVSTELRPKQQKFGILDAPNLVGDDILRPTGKLGCAVIYFDLDNFKSVNQRFAERVVDEYLLPAVQRIVAAAVFGVGYAYAEGGDEMIVLLPNTTLSIGAAWADAVRRLFRSTPVDVRGASLSVTASFGVAAGSGGKDLAERANCAKDFAKGCGKDCVAVSREGRDELWNDPLMS